MTTSGSDGASPPWSSTVKLVVSLTIISILGAFLIRFKNLIGPFLLIFVLSYLLHPLVEWLHTRTKLSWRMSVNVVFIVLIIVLLVSITAIGVIVIQQLQSLILIINNNVGDLPEVIANLTLQEIRIGNYSIDLSLILNTDNLELVTQRLLEIIQPILGRAGGILSTVASSTMTLIGWMFFIVIISYFILADLNNVPDVSPSLHIPGYEDDLRRLTHELKKIWNAFLRGQFILFVLTFVLYAILLSILGMKFVLAIALVAGLARFIPYAGAWITWIIIALVSLFQGGNYFGLENWQYMLLVLAVGFVVDTMFDNFVTPKVLGKSLGISPAVVLIAAVIAANLIGLIGVVLAAPVTVSLKLFGQYIFRKMLDMPPFPLPEEKTEPIKYPWIMISEKIWVWIVEKVKRRKEKNSPSN